MADLHDADPVTVANTEIEAFIRRCGGRIPDTAQPEYQRLIRAYLRAVENGGETGMADPGAAPLAA